MNASTMKHTSFQSCAALLKAMFEGLQNTHTCKVTRIENAEDEFLTVSILKGFNSTILVFEELGHVQFYELPHDEQLQVNVEFIIEDLNLEYYKGTLCDIDTVALYKLLVKELRELNDAVYKNAVKLAA